MQVLGVSYVVKTKVFLRDQTLKYRWLKFSMGGGVKMGETLNGPRSEIAHSDNAADQLFISVTVQTLLR